MIEESSKKTEEAIERIKKNPTVVRPSIGVFAGIFDRDGRVLLKKRGLNETLPGDWDLPGGAVEIEAANNALDERLIGQELAREVLGETGLEITVDFMPAMYPAVIKGGSDWAFIMPIRRFVSQKNNKVDMRFFSPAEVQEIAKGKEGDRLVSGVGKRMHRLALMALCHSPNIDYQIEAEAILKRIQDAVNDS